MPAPGSASPFIDAFVVVRTSMLCCASCCSFGTSNGVVGGVTLCGNARTIRQRWPGPSGSVAADDGVQEKVSVAPAVSATGSVPGTADVRKTRFPGSIRRVPVPGLMTRLGSPA